jgi:hypothetical protein
MNSLAVVWSPNWVPGFSMGFTRALQFYGNGMDTLRMPLAEKYLPVVMEFFKGRINTQQGPGSIGHDQRDQQASLIFRYVLPKANVEFYIEYGYGDFKANLRDLAIDAQHSAAYIIGFKKLFSVAPKKYFALSAEITQMGQSADFIVRYANPWYTHGIINQGFSHQNQILGAGSGQGNNVHTFLLEKVQNNNRYGVKIQRIQNDPNGIFTNFNAIWLNPLSWTDLSVGPTLHQQGKRFSIGAEMQFVFSKNYAWLPASLFNLYSTVSLSYKL